MKRLSYCEFKDRINYFQLKFYTIFIITYIIVKYKQIDILNELMNDEKF